MKGPEEPVGVTPARRATAEAPRARDRYLDLLRAVALARVVTYHTFDWAWLGYVFPALGVMFMMAGSLMAESLQRRPAVPVIRSRMRRLLPPFWVFGAFTVAAMVHNGWGPPEENPGQWWAQMLFWIFPVGDLPHSDWGEQLTDPLWYIRAYVWFVLLSPVLVALYRRRPVLVLVLSLLPMILLGVTEAEGTILDVVIEIATFVTCWLLGFAYRDRLIDRLPRVPVAALALVMMAIGALWALRQAEEYGTYDLNDLPLGQALWSTGFVLLLLRFRPRVDWLRRVPPLDRTVSVFNARAVTIYLWHEVALMAGVVLLDWMWEDSLFADHLPLDNQGMLFLLVWPLLGILIVLVGWVEDLAARRSPRLWP